MRLRPRRRARLLIILSSILLGGAALAEAAGPASAKPPRAVAVPRLAHVVLIVFENREHQEVMGSGAAPTLDRLAAEYAQATSYYAVSHPSLPNYLALVSGSTHNVTSDCTDCGQSGPTIGSQLSASGRNWAAYAEGY